MESHCGRGRDEVLNLVVISDTHLTRQTPLRRTDADYAETLFAKLDAVVDFAQRVQADVILHAGDVGDHVEWSFRTFNRLFGMAVGVPWIAVPGQHDLYGHRPESLAETPLGALQLSRQVTVLQDGDRALAGPGRGSVAVDVQVVGYGWGDRDVEAVVRRGESPWMDTEDEEMPRLLLTHYGLAPEEGHGVDCAVPDAQCTDFSLVVSGHWHRGFISEPQPQGDGVGTVYASPGALARGGIDDRDRPPLLLHVTVWEDDEERLEIERTPLPEVYGGVDNVHRQSGSRIWEGQCGTVWGATLWMVPHRPPEEVFDLAEWEQEERADAQAYLAALERAQELRSEDDAERIRRIGEASDFGEPVVECVIEHLPEEA